MADLRKLEEDGNYPALIREVRARVAADRRALADPDVKAWCGQRYRHFFLREAVKDETALAAASKDRLWRRDPRSDRQKIAERYLQGPAIEEWRLDMPPVEAGEIGVTVVFCPGLLNGMLPVRAFADGLTEIEKSFGCRVIRADLHPLRGSEANVANMDDAIEHGLGLHADTSLIPPEDAEGVAGDFMMIGYSKGVPDILTYLVRRPEAAQRVRSVFSWSGAIGGSEVADSTREDFDKLHADAIEDKAEDLLRPFLGRCRLSRDKKLFAQADITDAVEDLTTTKRRTFLEEHHGLFESLDIPFFTTAGSTSHPEVPWFQARGFKTLAAVDPVNDMQLTHDATHLPVLMSTKLALFRGHHWDVAYKKFEPPLNAFSRNLDHPFPKTAGVVAMVALAAELGLLE